jgi:phosphoribosylaminoimidazolecarboxamide formyltransferase/IMP cyclohydrolase
MASCADSASSSTVTSIGDDLDMTEQITLRYGVNPHQAPARAYADRLPFRVVGGAPGYINLLDALNSWQLVRELRAATGLPAAASFKHVSPSGAAVGVPLDDALRKAYFAEDLELSPLATAYARARGADRLCSYLDWVALSDPLDASTAELLRREICDGVVLPGFEPGALDVLRTKRSWGKLCVLEIDPSHEPGPLERREVFGVTLEQPRNNEPLDARTLEKVVTARQELSEAARRDLLVAQIGVKYTQSNSVALARGGQLIGVGAGQQSRVHCVRLACAKARTWFLKQHPSALSLPFRDGLGRADRDNAIDDFLRGDMTPPEEAAWLERFTQRPPRLTSGEKREWLRRLDDVALASDGLFPFRDNIDAASLAGVRYVVQPGGSIRDDDVVKACDEYGMVMAVSGVRLFHH